MDLVRQRAYSNCSAPEKTWLDFSHEGFEDWALARFGDPCLWLAPIPLHPISHLPALLKMQLTTTV